MADIFISYSTKDRSDVKRVVAALERQGLSVWWDQRIEEHPWSDQIEENLSNANRVIALITKNAVDSEKYYIVAEIQRAFDQKKLIPVQIGDFTQPIMFAGLTIGQQTYFFQNFDQFIIDEKLSIIGNLCRGKPMDTLPKMLPRSVPAWIESGPSVGELALGLSVAAIETAPLSVIAEAARLLEQSLQTALGEADEDKAGSGGLRQALKSRTSRMTAIGAVTYVTNHGRYNVDVDCVRFEDPRRSFELLTYFWDELDLLREPVIAWLNQLTYMASAQTRLRLGLMIGGLARDRFLPLFDSLISRWALHDNQRTRDVADVALSVVAMDGRLKSTVAKVINDWVRSNDRARLRAAVEIACGYTGFQFETLSVDILKAAAKSQIADVKIYDVMSNSIDFLLRESLESDDNTLFDLRSLLEGLADWVEYPEQGTPNLFPLYLFIRLMSHIPLRGDRRVYGRLALETFVKDDMRVSMARMFGAALRQFGDGAFSPRAEAQRILRSFMDQIVAEGMAESASRSDPLLALVQEIYRRSDDERDRDRLVFTVRRLYSREAVAASVPVLSYQA